MYTGVQVPTKARAVTGFSRAGVAGGREPPDMGLGTQLGAALAAWSLARP